MKAVKVIALLLAILCFFLGLFFIGAAFADKTKLTARLITGGMILLVSVVMFLLSKMKMEQVTHTYRQQIDLSGDVDLEKLKCKACAGTLSDKNITVKAGAVIVNCPYCGTSYHIEEAPKW